MLLPQTLEMFCCCPAVSGMISEAAAVGTIGIAAGVKSTVAMSCILTALRMITRISIKAAGIIISRQAQHQLRLHMMKFFFIKALK